MAKYYEMVERKRTYVLVASKDYTMTQVVVFCFDRMSRKRKEKRFSHSFLTLLIVYSLLAFPSPFFARRESCTGRGCQRLSVCRGIKFLSEKFFALENTVNSPSTFLAVDADKIARSSSVNGILHNFLYFCDLTL